MHSPRSKSLFALLLAVAIALGSSALAIEAAAADAAMNFVTRDGDQLIVGDKPLPLHLLQHPEPARDRRRLLVHQAQSLALAG